MLSNHSGTSELREYDFLYDLSFYLSKCFSFIFYTTCSEWQPKILGFFWNTEKEKMKQSEIGNAISVSYWLRSCKSKSPPNLCYVLKLEPKKEKRSMCDRESESERANEGEK